MSWISTISFSFCKFLTLDIHKYVILLVYCLTLSHSVPSLVIFPFFPQSMPHLFVCLSLGSGLLLGVVVMHPRLQKVHFWPQNWPNTFLEGKGG